MADVFLSYSSSDREHARRIATELEAAGFDVWWDRELVVSQDYDTTIEAEVHSAKCVLVLWSDNSVGSRWVRSEASVGDDRGVLVPARIDHARLPVQFRLIETADLRGWFAGGQLDQWQRVLVQVNALVGNTANGQTISAIHQTNAELDEQKRRNGVVALVAPFLLLIVFAVAGGLWYILPVTYSAIIAAATALALLAIFLFRFAESDLSPHLRALATRWLIPRNEGFIVDAAEAFNYLFEAVFGRQHFSAKCFVRSTMASIFFLTVILVSAALLFDREFVSTPEDIIGLALFAAIANLLSDYVSLGETRLLLRAYRRGTPLAVILAIDVVATYAIYFLGLGLAILFLYSVDAARTGTLMSDTVYLDRGYADLTAMMRQPFVDLFGWTPLPQNEALNEWSKVLLYGSFLTTFMTSIWLWLALIFGPLVRALASTHTNALVLVGLLFDVYRTPFTAIGYISAVAILIIGTSVSVIGFGLKQLSSPQVTALAESTMRQPIGNKAIMRIAAVRGR